MTSSCCHSMSYEVASCLIENLWYFWQAYVWYWWIISSIVKFCYLVVGTRPWTTSILKHSSLYCTRPFGTFDAHKKTQHLSLPISEPLIAFLSSSILLPQLLYCSCRRTNSMTACASSVLSTTMASNIPQAVETATSSVFATKPKLTNHLRPWYVSLPNVKEINKERADWTKLVICLFNKQYRP